MRCAAASFAGLQFERRSHSLDDAGLDLGARRRGHELVIAGAGGRLTPRRQGREQLLRSRFVDVNLQVLRLEAIKARSDAGGRGGASEDAGAGRGAEEQKEEDESDQLF